MFRAADDNKASTHKKKKKPSCHSCAGEGVRLSRGNELHTVLCKQYYIPIVDGISRIDGDFETASEENKKCNIAIHPINPNFRTHPITRTTSNFSSKSFS